MSTTSKLTKEQAQALLEAYMREQTAATEAAIAAYNAKTDTETAQKEEQLQQKMDDATQKANAAYDKQAIQALIDRRVLDEQIARWGLARSGTAAVRRQGVRDAATYAANETATEHRRALSDLNRQVLTARQTAERKKDQYAASARKTLASKGAEKRLSLMRGVSA